jgi:hypothetical protein
MKSWIYFIAISYAGLVYETFFSFVNVIFHHFKTFKVSNFPCGSKLRQDSQTDATDETDLNGFF